jgi:hypothetical protein
MPTNAPTLVVGYRAVTSATYKIRENSASGKHLVSEADPRKAETYLERGHRIVLVMVAVLQYVSMILSARQLETS